MTWFTLLLSKPGNKRCPNCGHLFRWDTWLRSYRSPWPCPACQSPLRINRRRFLIAMLIGFSVTAGGLFLLLQLPAPFWVLVVIGGIAIIVLAQGWLASINLMRREGAAS